MDIAPDPATAVGASAEPAVVLGSVQVTPAPATTAGALVGPAVVLGSVVVAPGGAESACTVNVGVMIVLTYPSYADGGLCAEPLIVLASRTEGALSVMLMLVDVRSSSDEALLLTAPRITPGLVATPRLQRGVAYRVELEEP